MDENYIPGRLPEEAVGGDMPDAVKRFEENYLKNHPGEIEIPHNIYHLVSEDREGNITGESFGINVLTDRGFNDMYKRSTSDESYNDYLYLGDGEFDTIDPASSTMVHAISTTSATMSTNTFSHQSTQYISEMQANKVLWKLCVGSYDYTVWDEDKTVTEIGISTRNNASINVLKYHAAIYDSEGNKSSFVKKVNEKLTITVWGRNYFPIVKIVNESWDKGFPCVIRSNALFQSYYDNYWRNAYICYHPYNWHFGNAYYTTLSMLNYDSGTITDHVFTSNKTGSMNRLMDGRYQYMSDVFIGTTVTDEYAKYGQWNSYFVFASKIKSPDQIPFRLEFFECDAYNSLSLYHTYGDKCLDENQDSDGQLPMTDIHISSLRMYNGQTDEWDIDVPFTEPVPYLDAGYWHLRYSVREQNWISFQNKYEWYTVFINEAPQYPIKQIMYCGRTMYATDEYWDSTTWEIIPNTDNISRELGSKRYFIMFESEFGYSSDPNPDAYVRPYGDIEHTRRIKRHDYDDQFPKLNLNNGYGQDYVNFGVRYTGNEYNSWIYGDSEYSGKAVENEGYSYIAQDGFIVFTDTIDPNPQHQYYSTPTKSDNMSGIPYIYNIGGVDLPANMEGVTGTGYDGTHPGLIWNTTRGSHIACLGYYSYKKGLRVYTITDDPTTAPTYQNFLFDQQFTDIQGFSHSDNGYLVIGWISGANNQNCVYVVEYDVEDVEPNMYKLEGYKYAFAIDLTNFFVAVDATVTDHLHMVIYDMANREIHDEFDIPEGYTFAGIAGWGDVIYIRVLQGGYATYVYHIQDRMLELTSLNISMMTWDASSWYSHIQRSVRANGNIESCMVLLSSNRDTSNQYHMLFKSSDPTNPIRLIRSQQYETDSYIRWQKAQLRYTNDNKQLLLTYATRRNISIDVSWALKHGTIQTHRCWGSSYYRDNDYICPIYHKGYIYGMRLYRRSSEHWTEWGGNHVHSAYHDMFRWPYQVWMDMCIEGTTYTPNSLMNPVRIQGDIATLNYQSTNRGVDTPEPYVPPEP
jgi:hypothetical protein